MHLKRIQSQVLGFLLLVSLSACSGGGDTPTPSPTAIPAASAEGLWTGTTNANRTATGVVLDDSVYWFLYSAAGDPSLIAGVVQGDSTSQNGSLTSSNTTDFSVERGTPLVLKATVDGTYTSKQSLNGTIVYQNNALPQDTFTTTYDNDYESAPDINAAAGTYTGPVAVGEIVSVTVSATGNITGRSITDPSRNGCTFSGVFKPRAHGNVFDVTITFNGQSGCSNGSATVTGVAFFHAGKLYSAALNGDKTNGVVFIGTKS
ncbi:MAG: hypothetical protein JSS39_17350 [Nitrospira sp.]|nr:hypothetical protein [Nitrospira sp.]